MTTFCSVYLRAVYRQNTRMNSTEKEWFASWFDSPYYPMLYRHRNEQEAKEALTNLHHQLGLPFGAMVLDLGCGQGRHSRTLSELGYNVVGIDLSHSSITCARALAKDGQRFEVQDMRSFAVPERFDAVFNLFTSFGYFKTDDDNLKVLKQIGVHLNKGGLLVIDYLNAFPLLDHQEQSQTIHVDHVTFRTKKIRNGNHIVKHIEVLDGEAVLHYRESVQLITLSDFQYMLQTSGFQLESVFGSYKLDEYSPAVSDRCLIIARKS